MIITNSGSNKIKSGSYVGNGGANQAISHNLKVEPKFVYVWGGSSTYCWFVRRAVINGMIGATINTFPVTSWDSVNFYVGNAGSPAGSGTENGQTFYWLAIG